jgi:hypothetical protein
MYSGQGILTMSNGTIHAGIWRSNLKNGFGFEKKPTGEIIVGNWHENQLVDQY